MYKLMAQLDQRLPSASAFNAEIGLNWGDRTSEQKSRVNRFMQPLVRMIMRPSVPISFDLCALTLCFLPDS
jgi:hypothetical protein